MDFFNAPSTPIQQIFSKQISEADIELYIKRDDLNHPTVSGNKLRKLRGFIDLAKREHRDTLLTFGGAYSNHIHATAAAATSCGFKSIGIIRGEASSNLSQTLVDAQAWGMQLLFVTREEYRAKATDEYVQRLQELHPTALIIPDGGASIEGTLGCKDIASEFSFTPSHICVACGTGTTLAGIVQGTNKTTHTMGFPVLKGGEYLTSYIESFIDNTSLDVSWELHTTYHFGGYAKMTPELASFIHAFYTEHNILLDPVYTGKMLYGVFDLIRSGYFKPGSKVVAIHTGGLQGWCGFPKIKPIL